MHLHNLLRKLLTPVLMVISGILLFTAVAAACLDSSVFDASYHANLFEKYSIYSQLEKTAAKAMQDYISKMSPASPENIKQREQLISLANKAVTPEMVRLNADALIEGMLKYISGEARFLPDIFLKPVKENAAILTHETTQVQSALSEQPLAGIDRISLNVVLMYMGRNDIINVFSEIRLLKFTLSYAPVFLLMLVTFLIVLTVLLNRGRKTKSLITLAIATGGTISFVSAPAALALTRHFLPHYLSSLPLAEYFKMDSLSGYINSLVQRTSIAVAVTGALLVAVAAITRLLPLPSSITDLISKKTRVLAIVLLLLFLTGAFLFSVGAFKNDFNSKDLSAAFARLRKADTYSTVIPARDGTIYSVEVRTIDMQSGTPIKAVNMKLEGKLHENAGEYSESNSSDDQGKSRFNVGEGNFKLELLRSFSLKEYKIPASYRFEVNNAGITIITVQFEKLEKTNVILNTVKNLYQDPSRRSG